MLKFYEQHRKKVDICPNHLRPLPNSQIPKFSNFQIYSIFFWFLTRNFFEMPKRLIPLFQPENFKIQDDPEMRIFAVYRHKIDAFLL